MNAEGSPAAVIAALVNSCYVRRTRTAVVLFATGHVSSQSVQRDKTLSALLPDVHATLVGLDFGGHSDLKVHQSDCGCVPSLRLVFGALAFVPFCALLWTGDESSRVKELTSPRRFLLCSCLFPFYAFLECLVFLTLAFMFF